MILSTAHRGRKAVAPPPKPSAELAIWQHFSRRFRETYGSRYPWEGTGRPWPTEGNQYAATGRAPWDGTWLPGADQNANALRRISQLCENVADACSRIDRLFAVRRIREHGISLAFIANWWDAAESDRQLLRRVRLVMGAARPPRSQEDRMAMRAALLRARGGGA